MKFCFFFSNFIDLLIQACILEENYNKNNQSTILNPTPWLKVPDPIEISVIHLDGRQSKTLCAVAFITNDQLVVLLASY